jgi:hypothetical protein
MITKLFFAFMGFAAFMMVAHPVQADAIEGTWCHKGQRINIEGDFITTPSGKRVEGASGRHEFSYKIPAGENFAGETVDMVQQHDTLVHATRSGSSQFEEWEPCPAPTS